MVCGHCSFIKKIDGIQRVLVVTLHVPLKVATALPVPLGKLIAIVRLAPMVVDDLVSVAEADANTTGIVVIQLEVLVLVARVVTPLMDVASVSGVACHVDCFVGLTVS